MKKLFIVLCLIPSLLLAEEYLVLWLNKVASNPDKVVVRDGLYQLLSDRSKITLAELPQWRLIANTNVSGYVCCINMANLDFTGAIKTNLTLAKLGNWKTNNMANPNHLQWRRGTDATNELKNAGLEPVPGTTAP
ncbi:MAG: hypothetical protein AAB875_04255 [Patescibacteria group bacterium]